MSTISCQLTIAIRDISLMCMYVWMWARMSFYLPIIRMAI